MKKLLQIFVAVIITSGITAFAVTEFTDSDSFPDWAADSIESVANMGVVQGYGDGSFRPNNNVTRGELAVMLTRFEKQMRYMTEFKVTNLLYTLDEFGYIDLEENGDQLAVVLAEAGFKRMPGPPAELDDEMFEEVEDVDLPDGYTLYSYPYSSYLKYDGFRNFGQDGWEVEEWYGPFTAYQSANRRNPMSFFYADYNLDIIED